MQHGFDRVLILASIVGVCFGASVGTRSLRSSSALVVAPKEVASEFSPIGKGTNKLSKGEHPAFKVVKTEHLEEFDVKFTLYKHIGTGAELMSVETDDDNKVFGAAFRTPAADDTGVPHIMEHSVLCGSRKYPVKDPFIQLKRTSLQTYLNALTYPDRTVYPVASQNLKDFYNLANVYLDATLHPRAVEDPMVLAQEGWHLELNKESDPLIIKGIVFNEMKGANSAPASMLHRQAMSQLFPNTSYRFNAAGDPKSIPDLTYEKFQAFHKEFYHPSNGRFYFYGNDPVDARLALLDSYLAEFSDVKPPLPVASTRIQTQKLWKEPRRAEARYPVTAKEASAKGGAKHMVTQYWLLNEDDAIPDAEQLGMSILTSLLLGDSTAPLYKALIKSKYGVSVTGGGFSDSLKQATFSVGMKGVAKEDVAKVEALIMTKLGEIAKDGFPKEAIEATLNSLDFSIRAFASGSANRGLSIFTNIASAWQYERDPIVGLKFATHLATLKANLKGERWLEGLIEKHLLKNTHRLTLEAVPDAEMMAREVAEEKKKLSDMKAAMSKEQIAAVIKETAALKAEQKSKDTKEQLATLPRLSMSDLNTKDTDFDITIGEKQGVKVLSHDVPTAGILYCQLVLDLSGVPLSLFPLLNLFKGLLFDVGTSKLSAADFTHKVGGQTGGINAFSMNALRRGKGGAVGDPNDIAMNLIVSGKATANQAGALFELMHMGITDSKLDNKGRALESLKASKAGLEGALRTSGASFAQTRVLARRSLAGYMDELTGGIMYYESLAGLLELAEKDWPKVLAQLQTINSLILDKKALLINLSGDKETLKKADKAVDSFVSALLKSGKERPKADVKGPLLADAMKGKPNLRLKEEDEGFVVASPVNYVIKGGEFFSEGDHISGANAVVVRLISQSYMWDKVRVMGGAYGGGCSLSAVSGTFLCYSYRDPNLKTRLDVFDSIASFVEKSSLDEKAIEQLVIGSVGDLDKPMTPASKGYSSMIRWMLNDTVENRHKRRLEMLATNADSFKSFAKTMRAHTSTWRSSIFGGAAAFTKANAALPAGKKIPLNKMN